jgi:flagellar biogenesis protein FliO
MNGLFGLELPTSVNFVIAFVVVLALIGAATWLVRRFGAPRTDAGTRNRQPRLAVIDSAAVDGRRKLVIIRRDNVEHLLMVGGPTDVVVETNIVRSGAVVTREAPAVRANGEVLPRAMPLPDATHWPLQAEPAAAAAQARPERVQDAVQQWPAPAEPAPPPTPAPSSAPAVRVQRDVPASVAADQTLPAAAPIRAVQQAPARAPAPKAAPVVQIDPQVAVAADQNLASMAHQLEAALRRPVATPAEAPKPAEQKRVEPVLRPIPKAAPAVAAAPVAAPQKQPVHSIEQEMASLLGRPGKS